MKFDLKFTQQGLALRAKAEAGTQLEFTRVGFGDGVVVSEEEEVLTLINEVVTLPINSIETENEKARISCLFTNSNIENAFYWREVGLYATDPDEGEILYVYANAGDEGDYIPSNTEMVLERNVNLNIVIGNIEKVIIDNNKSAMYVTMDVFEELAEKVDSLDIKYSKDVSEYVSTFTQDNSTLIEDDGEYRQYIVYETVVNDAEALRDIMVTADSVSYTVKHSNTVFDVLAYFVNLNINGIGVTQVISEEIDFSGMEDLTPTTLTENLSFSLDTQDFDYDSITFPCTIQLVAYEQYVKYNEVMSGNVTTATTTTVTATPVNMKLHYTTTGGKPGGEATLGVNISGNAATADSATKDDSGNVIANTYATKTEMNNIIINGRTTDLDTCLEEGRYVIGDPDNTANVPINKYGHLIVFGKGDAYRSQMYIANTGETFVRFKTGSGWYDWHLVLTDRTLDTIKQTDVYTNKYLQQIASGTELYVVSTSADDTVYLNGRGFKRNSSEKAIVLKYSSRSDETRVGYALIAKSEEALSITDVTTYGSFSIFEAITPLGNKVYVARMNNVYIDTETIAVKNYPVKATIDGVEHQLMKYAMYNTSTYISTDAKNQWILGVADLELFDEYYESDEVIETIDTSGWTFAAGIYPREAYYNKISKEVTIAFYSVPGYGFDNVTAIADIPLKYAPSNNITIGSCAIGGSSYPTTANTKKIAPLIIVNSGSAAGTITMELNSNIEPTDVTKVYCVEARFTYRIE